MTEERKLAILIAPTILSARKLADLENPDKPNPKKIAAVETAIRGSHHSPPRCARALHDRDASRFKHFSHRFLAIAQGKIDLRVVSRT